MLKLSKKLKERNIFVEEDYQRKVQRKGLKGLGKHTTKVLEEMSNDGNKKVVNEKIWQTVITLKLESTSRESQKKNHVIGRRTGFYRTGTRPKIPKKERNRKIPNKNKNDRAN